MKSQKEETPEKPDNLVEDPNDTAPSEFERAYNAGYASGFAAGKSEGKTGAPEKPDFEALVEGGSYLDWPESNAYKQGFVAGCERIWRDYVASKEVPQKKDDQVDGTMQTLG